MSLQTHVNLQKCQHCLGLSLRTLLFSPTVKQTRQFLQWKYVNSVSKTSSVAGRSPDPRRGFAPRFHWHWDFLVPPLFPAKDRGHSHQLVVITVFKRFLMISMDDCSNLDFVFFGYCGTVVSICVCNVYFNKLTYHWNWHQ